MIEKIYIGNELAAIIIRSDLKIEKNSIKFETTDDDSLQIGYMNREKNYLIVPHLHKPYARKILYTNEVLFIRKGKVQVDFYKNDKTFYKSLILNLNDFILLNKCGHGLIMLEDSEIIEVKQGPYAGNNDKERF